ncbi:MAG: hypothetical protein JWO99_714 [Candidatus Saccharibacteria bacterium]|nr:hypothetical protein [Candidatus Saccharibacteria bacterium]
MMVYPMRLRHLFLPNKKNNFHPIALRPAGLAIFLSLIVVAQLSYNVFSAHQMQVLGYAIDINVSDINTISNQQRTNAGLPALNLNSQLNSAALAKANDMFAKDYWAHNAPDGKTPWQFIQEAGYNYVYAGENLAMDFSTSNGVVSGWMTSPGHRANILNTNYQDVGYAVVNGTLQGEETTLVVAEYGSQQAVPAPAPAAQPVAPSAPAATQPAATTPAVTETPAPATTQPEATPQKVTKNITATTTQKTSTGVVADTKGSVKGVEAPLPIKVYQSLNWGQKASIVLLSTLLLLFIMKHTLVWRHQKRGYKNIWLRAHPLGQAIVLAAVLVVTISSGVGTVL